MGRLDGKIALITGTSSGIGRAAALRFAAEGAGVVCADLSPGVNPNGFEQDKTPTDETIRSAGGRAVFAECNVANEEQAKNAVDTAVRQYGALDVLVCNAGVYHVGTLIHETPEEILDHTLRVNVKGTWFCCQNAVRQFLKQRSGGTIVINASSSAVNPYPVQAAYSMSKAAVGMLAKSLALEYGPAGVNTNAIGPTGIKTQLTSAVYGDERLREMIVGKSPMSRWGEAGEVASLMLFLASEEARFLNGQMIVLDGGEGLSAVKLNDFGISFHEGQRRLTV